MSRNDYNIIIFSLQNAVVHIITELCLCPYVSIWQSPVSSSLCVEVSFREYSSDVHSTQYLHCSFFIAKLQNLISVLMEYY